MNFSRLRKKSLSRQGRGIEIKQPKRIDMKPVALIGPDLRKIKEVFFYWLDGDGKHHPGKMTLTGGKEPRIKLEGAQGIPLETPGRREKAVQTAEELEKELREAWTKKGIPKEKQDEIIREIEEKSKPGTKIGPFTI